MDYLAEVVDPAPGGEVDRDDASITVRVNPRRVTPERFVVKVNLPDARARWELPNRRFYTGFGFLEADWIGQYHVTVRLPVDCYGSGEYSLQFGDHGGNSTYNQRVEYIVRERMLPVLRESRFGNAGLDSGPADAPMGLPNRARRRTKLSEPL